jgi:hypothetical protein
MKMEYTLKNHLKYYLNDNLYGFRTSNLDKYKVIVGKVDLEYYSKITFADEILRVTKLINDKFSHDLVVFFSGGTDSEILIRSFIRLGLKPRLIIIKMTNDYNIEDVHIALQLAKEFNLPLEIIDFDIKDFYYSGEATHYAKEVQCNQIVFLMLWSVALKLGYPAVFGGNVPLTRNTKADPQFWYYTFMENEEAAAIRFSEKYNIPLIYEFFSYTPELMLLWLENSMVKKFIKENKYRIKIESSKNEILKSLIPEIQLRQKTHGFEYLIPFAHECHREFTNNLILRQTDCLDGIPYNTIIKMLKGQNEIQSFPAGHN